MAGGKGTEVRGVIGSGGGQNPSQPTGLPPPPEYNPDYWGIEHSSTPWWAEEERRQNRKDDNFRNSPLGVMSPSFTPFYGGGDLQLQDLRERYEGGQIAGHNITESGLGYMDRAAQGMGYGMSLAEANRRMGLNQAGQGQVIGQGGMRAEDAYLDSMVGAAGQNAGSAAALQQQMANDAQTRQMMAMAASARGGNQASAMRGAQAQGSQNALLNNQQLGLLRQQEDQARLQRVAEANQYAAGQMGNRAKMGLDVQNQGIGNANTATNTFGDFSQGLGNVGKNTADVGTTTTGQYLGAENQANTAQLNADAERSQKQREATQGWFGGLIGGLGKAFSFGG